MESWEVRVLLWGGGFPPHASDLDRSPPWGISIPGPLIFLLFFLFRRLLFYHHLLSFSGRVALPLPTGCSAGEEGEGVSLVVLSFPSPPSPPVPVSSPSPPVSAALSPGPLGLLGPLWNCRGLATMWVAPWR